MKKIYLTVLFVVAGMLSLSAQDKDTEKADEHFAELEYADAAEEYAELLEDGKVTPYVYRRLARSYYKLNDTPAAERYYAIVVEQSNATANDHYRYAQLLKANGTFEKSRAAMEGFARSFPEDGRAQSFMENPDYFSELMAKAPAFEGLEKLGANSSAADFGGHLFNGKFYFVSAREGSRKGYLDIYTAEAAGDAYTNIQALPGDANTKRHEGTVSITEDGQTMYFTRNGEYEKESKIGQLEVYTARWIAGEWTQIQPLPFNSIKYSAGHTALSPDGKTLYFSSDMPGGHGDTDLYRVAINGDGTYGEPENLGPNINTEGREAFPFIAEDGTLYFTSNGQLGLGGLDVFKAEPQGNGFGEVQNLGMPVNSHQDDFMFTYYPEKKKAFVSSNRKNNGDDIYTLSPVEKCANEVLVVVVGADTGKPISGASAKIYNMDGKFVAGKEAATGKVSFTQDCGSYEVQADAEGYFSNSVTVQITEEDKDVTIELQLPPEPVVTATEVVLNPIYFEFDKAKITPEAALELDRLVRLMKERPEMKIQVRGHTDFRGSDAYNLNLSDRRAKSTAQYIISQGIDKSRITGKGFGETMPEVECGNNCTEKQHAKNRRSEFRIVSE